MRNLNLDVIKIEDLPIDNDKIVKCVQVDNQYFVLSNKNVHHVKNGTNNLIKNNVRSIDWISVEKMLYMGDGTTFDCFNSKTEETNAIEIPGGFVIHEWNPSQDRLALIDNKGVLKIVLLDAFNSFCTVIGEYQLETIEQSPFINLGWGSQTTQFRGSEGKYNSERKNNDQDSSTSNNSSRIAWRDDGDLFTVSFLRDGQRIFKVFSCECEFLCESEHKPGLCAELAWKPDGSLLATENRSANGHQIMFFEKNGLHRYDLKLPTDADIEKIQWNPIGDILMVWQQANNISEISLWTCTNFKWYLKQSLVFDEDNLVNFVEWSDKRWLSVITSKNLLQYSWKWITLNTNENLSDDLGAMLVIDANSLFVTITSAQIIPPPFSSYNVKFSKAINYVAVGHTQNTIAVILNDYSLKVLKLTKTSYEEIFSGHISNNSVPLALNNFVFNENCLYGVKSLVNHQSVIYKYELDLSTKTVSEKIVHEPGDHVINLLQIYEPIKQEYYLGLCGEERVKICRPDEQTESLLPESDLVLFEDEQGGQCSVFYYLDHICSLSLNSQRFYYNGTKVANNITSYLFCQNYLLLTTTKNKLLCVKLSQKGLKSLETNNLSNVYTRSIPSGALLICAVPASRKIILQVPRGELEIINPRVLAINEIDRLLADKKHLEAFRIMRVDRINSNLFYDLNPTRFLNDLEDLIKNINNCEYLDIFLTQLQNSNISEELYNNCFEEPLPLQTGNKLFIVADKFIEAMKKIYTDFYLQSIVTAYLCKNTDENLEHALEQLSLAKQREESGVKLRVPVDSTLEHMIILSSVEKLYDIALGMDKLELIMWVASKSQLDPLEYIPFLRELVNMEDNYRNYKINCHIKRFEKAFTFLIKCDNVHDELKELIAKNSLYKIILKHTLSTNQWYKPLLQLYGEFLQKERHFKEAGLVFMKAEAYETALDNFVDGGCMKEALIIFHLLGSDVVKMNNSLTELATRLLDEKQFQNASFIYDTILNNYEQSINVLIKGYFWADASYLAYKNNRLDIIESEIKPAIVNYAENLCSNFKTYKDDFETLTTRLQTIRDEKIQQFKQNDGNFYEGEYPENDCPGRNFDLESVVSTTYSRTTSQRSKSSQMTSASLRRKKRIERKVLQIREGGAFENVAIIRRLHVIITEIQNLTQTVSETCMQLISYPEYYEKAGQLHSICEELITLITASRDIIWPQEMVLPPNPVTIQSQVYRLNLEHLEIQYRFPPQEIINNWKVISLEANFLL